MIKSRGDDGIPAEPQRRFSVLLVGNRSVSAKLKIEPRRDGPVVAIGVLAFGKVMCAVKARRYRSGRVSAFSTVAGSRMLVCVHTVIA